MFFLFCFVRCYKGVEVEREFEDRRYSTECVHVSIIHGQNVGVN